MAYQFNSSVKHSDEKENSVKHSDEKEKEKENNLVELIFYGNIKFELNPIRATHYQHFQHWSYVFALGVGDTKVLLYTQMYPFRKFKVFKD